MTGTSISTIQNIDSDNHMICNHFFASVKSPCLGPRFVDKDQTKFYDQISFRVNPGELCLSDNENNKGVFNFFKSVYRPRDFEAYKKPLLDAAKGKVKKQNSELASLKRRLVKATTTAKKDELKEKIVKAKAKLADWKDHLSDDAKLKKYYESEWRTFHGSDHYSLWVELKIDFSEDYLNGI